MAERELEASDILREFKFRDEIGRYELFLQLYSSPRKKERAILEAAIIRGDTLLKLLLLQYLEEVPELRSITYIVALIEDDDIAVWQAAVKAYRGNHYSRKNKILLPLAKSTEERAARFAIRVLAKAGDTDVLPILWARLEKAGLQVRGEILNAMRFLPDSRSIPALKRFVRDASPETRYRAIRALAELRARGYRVALNIFVRGSADDSPDVRKAALSGLRCYANRKTLNIFLEYARDLKASAGPRVRAIETLAAFPHRRWVRPLVELAARDDMPQVKLAAEIALRRFPPRELKAGLLPLLGCREADVNHQAALFLAEQLGSDKAVRERMIRRWHASADDGERLKNLDVLRELGGAELIPILTGVLRESPLLAYSAAGALNRIWTSKSGPQVLALLKDAHQPAFTKQALLSWLVRREPEAIIRDELRAWLVKALSNDTMNIRYLSLQVLAWYPMEEKIDRMLTLLLRESDPEVINTAQRQLAHGLRGDPLPLIEAVSRSTEREGLVAHMSAVMRRGSWDPERVYGVFQALTRDPLNAQERAPSEFLDLCIHLFAEENMSMEKIWLFLTPQMRLRFLERLRDAMLKSERIFPPLPIGFMHFHLAEGRAEDRALLYELIGLNNQAEDISTLAARLTREQDPEALALGRRVLHRLVGGAA